MKTYAIIVAGGSGTRMGTQIPKQFLLLKNKPIVFHTIEKFINCVDELLLVLPASQIHFFKELCLEYAFHHDVTIVEGGKERFHSVKNALNTIPDINGVVLIHDAVRPLLTQKLLIDSIEAARKLSNCIVAVPCKDSIRRKKDNSTIAVNRSDYFLVQTPQVFDLQLLKNAYNVEFDNFTDDASVFENAGHTIHLIEGEYSNIKITTKEDLVIAEAILGSLKAF